MASNGGTLGNKFLTSSDYKIALLGICIFLMLFINSKLFLIPNLDLNFLLNTIIFIKRIDSLYEGALVKETTGLIG